MIPHLAAALALAGVLAAMLYAPVIVRSGASSLLRNRFVRSHAWPEFLAGLRAFGSVVYDTLGLGLPITAAVIIAIATLASLIRDEDHGRRSARRTLALSVVVWCAILFVATRRLPPGRVLMYVAPIVCILAGIGLASLVRLLVRSTTVQRIIVDAIAVLLAVVLGTWEATQRVIDESEETDWIGFRDAPQVARFLLAELRPTDRLALAEIGPPLDYYFFTLGKRHVREFTTKANPSRVLLVVNERHRQTLEYVRNRRMIALGQFSAPRLLRQFYGSRVYELNALDTLTPGATRPVPRASR
jgi:FtsH-binding integral membrane protein